jgi:hypothetical protein
MPRKPRITHPLRIVRQSVAEIDPSISNQQKFSDLVGLSMSVIGGVEAGRYELGNQDRLKVAAATGADPDTLEMGRDPLSLNGIPYSAKTYELWRKLMPGLATAESKYHVESKSQAMLVALTEIAFRNSHTAAAFTLDLDDFLYRQALSLGVAALEGGKIYPSSELQGVIANKYLDKYERINSLKEKHTSLYTLQEAKQDPQIWKRICTAFGDERWLKALEIYPPAPDAKIFEVLTIPNVPAFDHLIGRVSEESRGGIAVIASTQTVWRAGLLVENGPAEWRGLQELLGPPPS